ncbi:MAG: hypothetical protein LBM41_04195 [Ruminococcus sp.]|jgi:hypothetical protein|nr:hypothetical protein [Ruminococcus sp.]
MKSRITASVLVIALGLAGCGVPEAAEVMATTETTMTTTPTTSTPITTVTTTAPITTVTTTAPHITTTEVTTIDPREEIYAIDFPKEFSCEVWSQPPFLKVPDELYDVEISDEAEKLYNDYLAFAKENVGDNEAEYPPGYMDGRFQHYPAGQTVYGLVDIDSDSVPEIFKFFTMGYMGSCYIDFYDLYSKEILAEGVPEFNRDGLTYFGKNEKGNLVICSGFLHSIHYGMIAFQEMIYDKNAATIKLQTINNFQAHFEMTYGYLNCIGYEVNDFGISERETGSYIPRADFEAAYREFYDTIDFDVYWICGDILYHGAEETEYKGKIAYEKYIEFTRNS